MNLLIIKMTSLGDVVHMLPALTEAASRVPGLRADWVVEEGFAAIPGWHPAVGRVIPSALRRWRRGLGKGGTWAEMAAELATFRRAIQAERYDLVLDAQGLIKSALVARLAHGPRAGLARGSARESLACLAYARRYPAPRELHAITRNRLLTAQALGYPMGGEDDLRYGLTAPAPFQLAGLATDYMVCLHGTARAEKEYPEHDWAALLARIAALGLGVALPWGNEREKARAERLAATLPTAVVLPRLGLSELGGLIAAARGVIGVDTGLMHLAAAFRKPGIGLYPATPPARFGVYAEADAPALINLSRPDELAPEAVVRVFETLFGDGGASKTSGYAIKPLTRPTAITP
ncbi:MAG: lipopolysaccharide heptosyltransferase I [Gallionellaceae bacterium]|nr:lipopolysaccharide heptosyltransferase I [Gallionellaceae bacterium]